MCVCFCLKLCADLIFSPSISRLTLLTSNISTKTLSSSGSYSEG